MGVRTLTARELLERWRSRRRQRGAAMAEGAIIIALMVVIFACMWGAVNYQNAKLRAMDDARAEAWKKSLAACSGGESMIDGINDKLGEAGAPQLPDTSGSGELLKGTQVTDMAEFKNDSGYMTVVKTKVGAFPMIMGGVPWMMQGKMKMRCNEPTLKSQEGKEKWVFGLAFGAGVLIAGIMSLI